jgi:hypothetical protein
MPGVSGYCHYGDYLLGRGKRQRTAALQDANAPSNVPDLAKRLGVRLPLWLLSVASAYEILRHHTQLREGQPDPSFQPIPQLLQADAWAMVPVVGY